MKVLIVGSPSNGEELMKMKKIANIMEESKDALLLISNEEPIDKVSIRETLKELEEPLLIKALPRYEEMFFPKQRRTNHERKPSRYP